MIANNNRKYAFTLFKIFAIIFLCVPSVLKADVVFIANPSVQLDTISKSEIKKIYLGHRLAWPDGNPIKLTIQEKSDIQNEFTKTYIQKTESQFLFYWRRLLFTGKGIFPKPFPSEKEMISYVAHTKGAIGYVSSGSVAENVKIIHISAK